MGRKKKQKTTVTPGWTTPPATAATTSLTAQAEKGYDYETPIRQAFGLAQQRSDRTYKNPLGAYSTQDTRDKSMREDHQNLGQRRGMALSNAAQQSSADKFNRTATVANATSPRLYNAQTQSVQSQPFNWGSALGGVAGAAKRI